MATTILAEPIELLENTLDRENKTVGVVLIRPGWSKNGRHYSREVLAQAASLFEGVKAYANHPTREQLRRGEGRSVLDITGDYTNVHIGESGELRATRHVYGQAGEAVWPLIERAVSTQRPIIGVSINALGKAKKGTRDGRDGVIVESIDVANSADDVDAPAAGGGFESLMMSDNGGLLADILASITYEELIEARPDFLSKDDLRDARQERDRAMQGWRTAQQQADEQQQVLEATQHALDAARKVAARLLYEVQLERALREANLPAQYEKTLREQLEKVEPGEWLTVLAQEREKTKALGLARQQVAVSGAPQRAIQPIKRGPVTAGPINPDDYNSPYELAEAIKQRQRAKVRQQWQ